MSRAAALTVEAPPRGVAAVYVRLSRDRTGAGVAVDQQERECRPLAEQRGYLPDQIEVYADNDISAFSGKIRPRYRDLLRDIESGKVTFLVAWHNDRLHRSMRELAQFIDVIRTSGIEVQTARAGSIDLSTPTGRMMAFNLGNIAEYESAHKSERHLVAEERLATTGKAHGGRRPFGFEADRVTIRDDEALLIREAARTPATTLGVYRLGRLAVTSEWSPSRWSAWSSRPSCRPSRAASWRACWPGVGASRSPASATSSQRSRPS